MDMRKAGIFAMLLLFPRMAFSEVAENKSLTEPMSIEVEVEEDVHVQYGRSNRVAFKVLGSLSPPLKDCSVARLQAWVRNSNENFKIPSEEAKLDYDLNCLSCSNHLGGLVKYIKIKGVVGGEDLRGEHYHERAWVEETSRKFDRFGMSVSRGDKGVASIKAIERGESCEWVE